MRTAIVAAIATAVGIFLAYFDRHSDDTGIEVGLLLLSSIVFAAIVPKRWWLVAMCVGLPIPLAELANGASIPAGSVALAFTVVGALIGFAISRASRTSPA